MRLFNIHQTPLIEAMMQHCRLSRCSMAALECFDAINPFLIFDYPCNSNNFIVCMEWQVESYLSQVFIFIHLSSGLIRHVATRVFRSTALIHSNTTTELLDACDVIGFAPATVDVRLDELARATWRMLTSTVTQLPSVGHVTETRDRMKLLFNRIRDKFIYKFIN